MLQRYWWLWGLLVLGTVGYFVQQGQVHDPSKGPIPKRFHGAYNSMGCPSGSNIASLVTVGGTDINYNSASFKAEEVVSEGPSSITVRGRPSGAGWSEGSRTYTLTYVPVGGTAMLNGSEYERCSEY